MKTNHTDKQGTTENGEFILIPNATTLSPSCWTTSTATYSIPKTTTLIKNIGELRTYEGFNRIVVQGTRIVKQQFGMVQPNVFKIVFSCIDGKWNKSDRIYGKIIPPSEESYEF